MKTYTQDELSKILELHRLFLKNDPSGVQADLKYADLRNANLNGADLRHINLRWADLKYADLRNANLNGADLRYTNLRWADLENTDLDYSSWPLWCGSFEAKVDTRIAAQLAYHFCRLNCDDPEYVKARNAIVKFANKFHRVGESGMPEVEEI